MQRDKNDESISTNVSRIPSFVASTAAASCSSSAHFNFDLGAFGQSLEFYKQGFSRKSLAPISAIRN